MLETLQPDKIFFIASFLENRDLLNLALTSSHFGAPRIYGVVYSPSTAASGGGTVAPTAVRAWSLVEEAARQNIVCNWTRKDKEELEKEFDLNRVSRWLFVAHRLRIARGPLTFRAFNDRQVTCINGDFSHVSTSLVEFDGWEVVFCRHAMRRGKYYATFTLTGDPDANLQVGILPAKILEWQWNPKTEFASFCPSFLDWCADQNEPQFSSYSHSCFYSAYTGYDCAIALDSEYVGVDEQSWSGMDACSKCGDEIGLLLDLDEGTLSVEKNGWLLGVMRKGLIGEYVWAVRMCKMTNLPGTTGPPSVRIERAPVPEYISVEEQAWLDKARK